MNLPPPSGEMPCYPPPAFSGHEFSASAAADPTELTITRPLLEEALAAKPAILLADEPTGNLDSKTSQDVLGLMKVTGQKFGQTMVMITHNEEVAQTADRIVRIEDGRIVTR